MKRLPLLLLVLLGAVLAACSPAGTEVPVTLQVKRILPALGAVDVPVDTVIVVEFTGQLDTARLTDSIVLVAYEQEVSGSYHYDEDGMTLMFIPDTELAHGTKYSVEVTDWVRGLSGATLARAVEWSFTTADASENGGNDGGDDTPVHETPGEKVPEDELPEPEPGMPSPEETEIVLPGVVSVNPMPWTRATRDTTVDVLFTKEFNAGLLEDGVEIKVYSLFWGALRAWLGVDIGSQSGTLTGAGDTATYTFNRTLNGQAWYWVFLEIDLEDDAGNPLRGKASWLFKTISNR